MASTNDETEQPDAGQQRRSRHKGTAAFLSFLCPGLGFMYVGRLWQGLVANLVVVLSLVAFVGMFAVTGFFPALPLLVLVVGWLVFGGFVAGHVRSIIDERSEPFALKGYNHWTIYSATFLLAYVLPLAATLVVSNQFVWELDRVESRAMYPSLEPGDMVLVGKSAYQSRKPQPAELVAYDVSGTNAYRVLRVLASGETTDEEPTVRMAGESIYVGGEALSQVPYDTRIASAAGGEAPEYELWVERNRGHAYLVSLRPSLRGEPNYESTDLDDDQFYLLADNRSYPADDETDAGDSRDFGPVRRGQIAGKPLYIAWSTSPSTGKIRWNRIGLRLQ